MEEESEKRKERLRAMRMQAEQVEVSGNVKSFPVPCSLSNPLAENSATQQIKEQSNVTPRFDFYTDPMAAFSANKKKGQSDNQSSYSASATMKPSSFTLEPRNSEATPSLAHQLQSNSPFYQRMYGEQGPYSSAATYGSSRGMAGPFPMHHGAPEAWNRPQATTGKFSSGTDGYRSPRGMVHPFPMMHQGTPCGSGAATGHNPPYNASRDWHFVNPEFGPSFSYGQGRIPLQGNSFNPGSGRGGNPGPSSGRGRGQRYGGSTNPTFGRGGVRDRRIEGKQGPECFYKKSMDENPWQQLEPIVWKSRSLNSSGTSDSWLPDSISMKKVRVSEASSKSASRPSLAEYLAASFNEAANDAPNS